MKIETVDKTRNSLSLLHAILLNQNVKKYQRPVIKFNKAGLVCINEKGKIKTIEKENIFNYLKSEGFKLSIKEKNRVFPMIETSQTFSKKRYYIKKTDRHENNI